MPAVESIGPISLPHPERLQIGRPDFNIAHYATDTGIWRQYFSPGLHDAFGALWPLVLGGALAAALLALFGGRDRSSAGVGAVALFGMLAYLFTPLGAAGAEGEPVGFAINIRFVIPALLLGPGAGAAAAGFLDAPSASGCCWRRWSLVFLVTDRPDEALHDPARLFALLLRGPARGGPGGAAGGPRRGAARALVLGGRRRSAGRRGRDRLPGPAPLPRGPLRQRRPAGRAGSPAWTSTPPTAGRVGWRTPGSGWPAPPPGSPATASTAPTSPTRSATSAYDGPHGAFNAIPTCAGFRAAVNAADLDYLVTSPFLNFLHPDEPMPSPEARWLHGEGAVAPLLRSGQVTVWKVDGELDPGGCGAANAPLREVPDTPGA